LRQPLTEALSSDLRTILYANGAIFLRGQDAISFKEHLALAEIFGRPIGDGPDLNRPQITPVRAKARSREGTASSWHSDGCYRAKPPIASILRAIEPCTFGGDTCFASSVAAYAGLSEQMKDHINGLCFNSSLAATMPKDNKHFGRAEKWEQLRAKYPPVTQPVVLVHHKTIADWESRGAVNRGINLA
jgi:taurine dioxygenase